MSALVRSELGARWWKFSVVGLLGMGVQLAALSLLVCCGLHYLLATAKEIFREGNSNTLFYRKKEAAVETA